MKVQYRNNDTNAGDNQLRPHFRIVNTGDEAVPLSELTLRYYYTIDGDKSQQFNCDYAFIGSGNVSGRFVKLIAQRTAAITTWRSHLLPERASWLPGRTAEKSKPASTKPTGAIITNPTIIPTADLSSSLPTGTK